MKRIVLLIILSLVSTCEARAPKSTKADATKDSLECRVTGAMQALSGIISSFESQKKGTTYTREEIIRMLKYDMDGIAELRGGK